MNYRCDMKDENSRWGCIKYSEEGIYLYLQDKHLKPFFSTVLLQMLRVWLKC